MKNSINVYWCPNIDEYQDGTGFAISELANPPIPEPLSKVLRREIKLKNYPKDDDFVKYFSCPASQNELKNIFVVRAPYNLNIKINFKEGLMGTSSNDPLSNYFLEKKKAFIRNGTSNSITLSIRNQFFSSSPVEMSQIPAYYADNNFVNNSYIYSGKYDISKWFRAIDTTFRFKNNFYEIDIKKGDILYYVQFHTNKKIKIKEFKFTKTLQEYETKCTSLKNYITHKPLEILYNLFLQRKFNKRILKEIKANLM